mmetsp:Transcript_21092/g.64243  ORF Transcript_21092/g.64243 Transcript_21092/m.64243 type:complete len:264 (+) Transcript_21092:1445-2236(+)
MVHDPVVQAPAVHGGPGALPVRPVREPRLLQLRGVYRVLVLIVGEVRRLAIRARAVLYSRRVLVGLGIGRGVRVEVAVRVHVERLVSRWIQLPIRTARHNRAGHRLAVLRWVLAAQLCRQVLLGDAANDAAKILPLGVSATRRLIARLLHPVVNVVLAAHHVEVARPNHGLLCREPRHVARHALVPHLRAIGQLLQLLPRVGHVGVTDKVLRELHGDQATLPVQPILVPGPRALCCVVDVKAIASHGGARHRGVGLLQEHHRA